jgi:hypothetical protein
MATISTKQLTDELSLLSKKVDTSQIEGTLEHVGTFLETSASSTLASIDLNEVKGGLKSLTQDLDNVADILSTQTAPTITKLDESASDLIDNLKTDISSIDLSNINKVFADEESNVSEMFAAAQPQLAAATGMLKEIIADGSVQAQIATLKNLTGKTVDELTPVLKELVDGDKMVDTVEGFIKDLDLETISSEISGQLTQSLEIFDKQVSSALQGLDANNLIKSLVELKTFNIQNVLQGVNLADVDITSVTNLIISGKVEEARNAMVAGLNIPEILRDTKTGLLPSFATTGELQKFLSRFSSTDSASTKAIEDLQSSLNAIDTNIKDNMANISGAVTPGDEDTTDNENATTDVNKAVSDYNVFSIINSKEELIKYFQSTRREITTLEVRWAGATLDNALTTASDLASNYESSFSDKYKDHIKGGPSHFYIRKDGTIETMRPLNAEYFSTEVEAGSNSAKHGVSVMINAGWNAYMLPDGSFPNVAKLTPKSVTTKQMESLHRIVSAFYAFIPAGDVYSRQDLFEDQQLNPGFSMNDLIQQAPYSNENTNHHIDVEPNDHFLSPDELGKEAADRNEAINAEQSEIESADITEE